MSTTTSSPASSSFSPSSIWWLFLLRGIAGILLGAMLVSAPGVTVVALVTFLGFYWLITAVPSLVQAFVAVGMVAAERVTPNCGRDARLAAPVARCADRADLDCHHPRRGSAHPLQKRPNRKAARMRDFANPSRRTGLRLGGVLPYPQRPADRITPAACPQSIGTAWTDTSTCNPVGSSALPMKPPDIGSACSASLVTPTRIRFAPAIRPFVGSYSTHPAPGK
jgi:hypothetical protein